MGGRKAKGLLIFHNLTIIKQQKIGKLPVKSKRSTSVVFWRHLVSRHSITTKTWNIPKERQTATRRKTEIETYVKKEMQAQTVKYLKNMFQN